MTVTSVRVRREKGEKNQFRKGVVVMVIVMVIVMVKTVISPTQ